MALICLAVLILPILFIILIIKLDSPGKAVFKQERIGKNKKVFYVYKFRTMKNTDVPFDVNHPVVDYQDKRLTNVGKIIRRFKIDELLQLINVLKGEMSFIGPRPLMAVYLPVYSDWEMQKFNITSGLSGLAQVSGNGYLSIEERSYYDLIYLENRGLLLDIKIFVKTIGVVLFGEKVFLKNVKQEKIEKIKEKYSNI